MDISRFPVPELEDLPEDIRDRILAVQSKSGFVPNVFLVLAHRPDEFRAFFSYHDTVMEKESGLTKAEKEMIVVATSSENNCLYCVVSHGAVLRIRSKNSLLSDQIATNYRKADISDKHKAMLKFSLKVCNDSSTLEESDFLELESHGFTREDAWDMGAIVSFFALSNRMANLTAMQPNPEFYGMARTQ